MGKTVLIDGHSILNRAYYGIPSLSNAQGLHTNAIYGFLNILFRFLDEEKPDYLAVAFDVHAPTFRHKMYPEYKGTRHPMPDELREQVPVLKELLQKMNIRTLERAGYEADDILGTLGRIYVKLGCDVTIVSGDRDLLQLSDEKICVRIPKTKGAVTEVEDYFPEDVKAKYGVTPEEFIDMKALMGDSSDNIKGVPGIGEKTASKIIGTWHSIENAYEHASEIKPKKASENLVTYWEDAKFAKKLVTIKTDCELDFDPQSAVIGDMMNEESYAMMKKLELKNIISRFEVPEEGGNEKKKAELVTDAAGLEKVLAAVTDQSRLGMCCICEDGLEGLAVSGTKENPEDTVFLLAGDSSSQISSQDLRGAARRMVREAAQTWFCDLKSQLDMLELDENDRAGDVSIAAYLLNPLADSYGCDIIASSILGETVASRQELFHKDSLKKAFTEQRDKFLSYMSSEARVPLQASGKLMEKLEESGMDGIYHEIEMPLLYVLHEMECQGIRVERSQLEKYGQALSGRIDELEQDIYDLAGESFNINSPKQLGTILFEKLNLPGGKKTKTGYSTSAAVLEKIRDKDPIIGKILEYRQLTKLKSTYADGLVNFIHPDDQRIHCKFNQTITATGRISSADPNLQNIPVRVELGRQIRKVFVPEEGKIFVNADYSQIELRVLAHMAGDENLIEAYRENRDIHRTTASKVFHIPFDEVTPAQRRSAKAVNFGIVYGISSFGLSQNLDISRKEAQGYIQQYFATYPGIKTFMDKCVSDAKEKGYSVTMYGRRRPIPELKSKNFAQRNFGERAAMNSPIQGTAADIIKIAMLRVSRRLKAENMKSQLILQIHDELLIEAVPEEVGEVKKILEEEMCGAADLAVPLIVDMNSGYNWYELK